MSQESFHPHKDQINNLGIDVIKSHLNDKIYSADTSQKWCTEIASQMTSVLKEKFSLLKIIVNVVLIQKSDSGMNMSSACCWNQVTDGSVLINWSNSTINCIINVFGLSF